MVPIIMKSNKRQQEMMFFLTSPFLTNFLILLKLYTIHEDIKLLESSIQYF